MTELTETEKQYNAWWMSCFDANQYKTILLINHGRVVQEYTTLNARYTDQEDAESAFWTAEHLGVSVTTVVVGNKRFKKFDGRIQRITDLEERDDQNCGE